MKRLIVCCLILPLLCCKQKIVNNDKNYKMEISFYVLGLKDNYNEKEIIEVEEKNKLDAQLFVYKYKHLKENNDTLSIHKDSVYFNNNQLTYLKSKQIINGKDTVIIKKYVYDTPRVTSNVYVDANGLILINVENIASNTIIEYHHENEPTLINEIMHDSVFF